MPQRPTGKRRPVAPSGPGDDAVDDDVVEASPVAAAQDIGSEDEADLSEGTDLPQEPGSEGDDGGEPPVPEGSADLFPPKPLSPRREAWRKRSATGAILTGFALGLQQVFEPETKEPAIVMETSGDPPRDLPVEAELELATSRRSVVRIRPWLLEDAEAEQSASGEATADDGADAPADEGHD